jgi:hypothetical protein
MFLVEIEAVEAVWLCHMTTLNENRLEQHLVRHAG